MNDSYTFTAYDGYMTVTRWEDGPDGVEWKIGTHAGKKEKGDPFNLGSDAEFIAEIRLPDELGESIEIEWDSNLGLYVLRFGQNGTSATIRSNGFRVILD